MVANSFGGRIAAPKPTDQQVAEIEAWMTANIAPVSQRMPSLSPTKVATGGAGGQTDLAERTALARINGPQGETGGNTFPGSGGVTGQVPINVATGAADRAQDLQTPLVGGRYITGDAENPGLNFTDIQTMYQNPNAYLDRVLSLDGMDTMGAQAGMRSLLDPYAQNIWHLAQLGLGGGSLMPEGVDVMDWAGQEMSDWTQPGTFYDMGGMLGQIANAKEGSNLGAYLTIDSPAGQVQNTEGLIAAGANMSMNPMMRSAAMDYISRLGDKYIAQGGATSGLQPYYKYLAEQGVLNGGLGNQ